MFFYTLIFDSNIINFFVLNILVKVDVKSIFFYTFKSAKIINCMGNKIKYNK